MRVRHLRSSAAAAGAAALLAGIALAPVLAGLASAGSASAATIGAGAAGQPRNTVRHVLLLSVDGLHQQDLAWYVRQNPASVLASLVGHGIEYSDALTPIPSDSSPGMVAQVTGGDPGVTGIYYDDTWNHALFPAGTTNCSGPVPGAEAAYEEAIDVNPASLDAGQGLGGLPGSILNMTSNPLAVINPASLPVNPKTCRPIYPNQYLQVNTIFNVARQAGLRTAWSDKHPAYQMFSGPSGNGVEDYFTPEINSDALGYPAGEDWTSDNAATMQYDNYKVQAILNEIDGYNHSRTSHVGVPGIFGMNFQTISTAQKLPTSDGLTGGYLPGGKVPGPLLVRALNYLSTQVGRMVAEIRSQGLAASTALVISAKHGQSPADPSDLRRVPDAPIIAAVNAAWTAAHPGAWRAGQLLHRRRRHAVVAQRPLASRRGLREALPAHAQRSRQQHRRFPGDSAGFGPGQGLRRRRVSGLLRGAGQRPAAPDIFGIVQHGVVYTGGQSKIAEHGGAGFQDRNVPILVDIPGLGHGERIGTQVETTQIAPTILGLLGLNPQALQAVRIEHTRALPGLPGGWAR